MECSLLNYVKKDNIFFNSACVTNSRYHEKYVSYYQRRGLYQISHDIVNCNLSVPTKPRLRISPPMLHCDKYSMSDAS